LAFVCSAAPLCARRLLFEAVLKKINIRKKQQRHARAEERIQILNFVFHRKKRVYNLNSGSIQNLRPFIDLFLRRLQKIAIYFPFSQQQPW